MAKLTMSSARRFLNRGSIEENWAPASSSRMGTGRRLFLEQAFYDWLGDQVIAVKDREGPAAPPSQTW